MSFHVGQKVVCVETWESGFPEYGYGDETGPVAGHVYTIREITCRPIDEIPGVRLEEIFNEPRLYEDRGVWEQAFRLTRFRPVRTTSIDIFEAMLTKAPEQVDA